MLEISWARKAATNPAQLFPNFASASRERRGATLFT